jgi:hypothetical protein
LKTNSRKQMLIPRSCLLLMCGTRLHLHDRGSPILASPIRHFAMAGNAMSQNLKTGPQKPSRPRNSPNSPRYNATWPNCLPVRDDNSLRSSMRK